MPPEREITVLVVAGEASGDNHGARLVQAMREIQPDVKFYGLGGKRMAAAGVRLLTGAADIAVVGITEALTKVMGIVRAMRVVKRALRERRPDLVILIDYPDFNLHVAKTAKGLGIKVLYYISPQLWAWRRGRIEKIKKNVDKMAVILPFEEDLYRAAGVDVSFVGHPLLDEIETAGDRQEARIDLGLAPDLTTLALLPGSRKAELRRHLPVLLKAGKLIEKNVGALQFVLPVADSMDERDIAETVENYCLPVTVVKGKTYAALAAADLAIVASGTATLETALFARPMIIIYRLSWFSYFLGRLFIRIKHIGLVNIMAGKTVVPELIQRRANAEGIAEVALSLLKDEDSRRRMIGDLMVIKERLGTPGASARTARLAHDLIG